MWQDTRDPIFMLDLSSPVSADLPFPTNVLREYTPEFEIRVEKALVDLRECLREAVKDKDYYKELADTLMEDIEEMSSAQESELVALRVELDWRGPTSLGTEAECVRLRSQVVGLEDELATFTRRFVTLDHTWDEERASLEVGRAKASSRADGLALELV